MHWKSVLFKHLQLARDPVLGAYGLTKPHVLLDRRNCHNFGIVRASVKSLSLKESRQWAKLGLLDLYA